MKNYEVLSQAEKEVALASHHTEGEKKYNTERDWGDGLMADWIREVVLNEQRPYEEVLHMEREWLEDMIFHNKEGAGLIAFYRKNPKEAFKKLDELHKAKPFH